MPDAAPRAKICERNAQPSNASESPDDRIYTDKGYTCPVCAKLSPPASNATCSSSPNSIASAPPHGVDFQHIPTGRHCAECTQPNRAAAEAFALDKLVSLGEDPAEAGETVKLAGYTAADAVRIYPVCT